MTARARAQAPLDVTFEIPLQGRPRSAVVNGHARVYKASADRSWEGAVALAAKAALPPEVIDGPVLLEVTAILPRPKYMLARRRDGSWKYPVERVRAPCKPDLSNIVKAVEDGMRACWRDDAQVCALHAQKFYADLLERPRVIVRVRTPRCQAADTPPTGGAGARDWLDYTLHG